MPKFFFSLFILVFFPTLVWAQKPNSFSPILLSFKGKAANHPQVLNTTQGLYLTWFQWQSGKDNSKNDSYFFAISEFEPEKKSFGVPWKSLETNVLRIQSFSTTVIALLPISKVSQKPASFLAVLDKFNLLTEGIGPVFWSGIFEPIASEKKYKLVFLNKILSHEYFSQAGKGYRIKQLQIIQRKGYKNEGIFLLGSGFPEIWLAELTKDGKFVQEPSSVFRPKDLSLDQGTSGIITPDQKFIVFFSQGNNYFRFIRSEDGKKWREPKEVETPAPVNCTSSCLDAGGNIWVGYITRVGKKNSLYVTRSKDQANTWAKPLLLVEDNKVLAEPSLAVAGKYLIVAYKSQERVLTLADLRKLAKTAPEEVPYLEFDRGQVFGLIIPLEQLEFKDSKGQ